MEDDRSPADVMEEDLIPAYKCVKCKRQMCKDEVDKRLDGFKCECIHCNCSKEVEE